MLAVFQQAVHYPVEFISCLLLALMPVIVWLKIFLSKHPEKRFHVILTFLFGIFSAALIMIYQSFWGKGSVNLLFFNFEAVNFKENISEMVVSSVLVSFLIYFSVGFLEEISKHYATVKADRKLFESIDDVIELSIVSALGFAFLENIGYFFSLIISGNGGDLFSTFIVRSIFVVFVHILCSAIYGYFYGLGHFAKPYMQMEIQKGRKFILADIFHKFLHFRSAILFRERMMMEGLIMAVLIHGVYDFLMDMHYTITIGEFSRPLSVVILPLYLGLGYWYLSFLLNKKENLVRFGHIYEEPQYITTEAEIGSEQLEQDQKLGSSSLDPEKLHTTSSGSNAIVQKQIAFVPEKI